MYWTSFKCYKVECTVDYFYPSLREVVDRYVVPSSTHSQLTHWVLIQDIAGYCWSQRYTRISSYQGRSSNTCDQIKNEGSRGNLRKHEQGCDLCALLHCNNFTKTNNAKAQGIPILANVNILSPYHPLILPHLLLINRQTPPLLPRPPPLPPLQLLRHRPRQLPPLLPLPLLLYLHHALPLPAPPKLLPPLLSKRQEIVASFLHLALIRLVLVIRVVELRVVVIIVGVFGKETGRRFELRGSLVARTVPGSGAGVGDAG